LNTTPASRRLLSGYAWVAYAFLYLPIVVLIIFSFNTQRVNATWEGFTFSWYAKLFTNAKVMTALKNSLIVAAVSTPIATVLGTMGAFAVHRLRFSGRRLIEGGMYIPVVLPEIIMGISLLSLFTAMNFKLGLVTVIIAHITFSMPFVFVTVRARLADMTPTLERAAMDLGADEWLTFWWVTFPLVAPGILAGAMLAFTLSLDDVIITFFASGPGATTLPLQIYSMVRFGVSPEINALSTIILVVTLAMVLTAERIRRRGT
jgi:spermidine/putrescine transport system permease protein